MCICACSCVITCGAALLARGAISPTCTKPNKLALFCLSVPNDGVKFLCLLHQTVSDIERGWILVNKDQHRQLKSLQEKGSKKEVSKGNL